MATAVTYDSTPVWATGMGGLQAMRRPFLLSPCFHLQLVRFVFCTVKNSVSEYLKNTAIARNSIALNKSKSSMRRERVNCSQVVGWKYQDPDCKLFLRSARNSSGGGGGSSWGCWKSAVSSSFCGAQWAWDFEQANLEAAETLCLHLQH